MTATEAAIAFELVDELGNEWGIKVIHVEKRRLDV